MFYVTVTEALSVKRNVAVGDTVFDPSSRSLQVDFQVVLSRKKWLQMV